MKSKVSRSLMIGIALVFAGLSMTSCNKGYGCPTDFSIAEKVAEQAVQIVIDQVK